MKETTHLPQFILREIHKSLFPTPCLAKVPGGITTFRVADKA